LHTPLSHWRFRLHWQKPPEHVPLEHWLPREHCFMPQLPAAPPLHVTPAGSWQSDAA
jgi:hypothetical protein